jgi:multiple sugar transport system substrate-binding protein
MSRRSFLRAASFATMGLAMAACAVPAAGPSTGEDAGEAAPSDEMITIRFHARIGAQEDALYDMQMPKFMEEHPNIELVKESFPGEEFSAKVATMQAGGTLGDAIWSALGQAKIQFAWAQGQVAPIDDLVASQNVDLSQWYEGCVKAITVDGNLLGLPFKAHPGMAVTYYNKKLFDEAGLDYPTPEWDQAALLEMAQATTKVEGDRTVQFGYKPNLSWKGFVTLLRAFGGQLISEDGTTFQLTSDEGVAAVNYAYDLHHKYAVAPKPDEIIGSNIDGRDMWSSGMLGLFQAGTWASNLDNVIAGAFEWMVGPNAIGPGGVGGSDYEVDAYCVTTATKHPNEAFEWVQYLCNQDSGIQLGVIGGTVGGRPDVYGSEILLQHDYRQAFKEIMDNAMDSRITANWRQEEAEKAWDQLTQPLWAGDEQPTDAFIGEISSQIQDIMDQPRP